MGGFIFDYQGLIGSVLGGIFALGAAGIVFVEGNRQLAAQRARDQQALKDREKIAAGMVTGLENHLGYLRLKLAEFEELLEDYLDNCVDFPQIRLPAYPVEFRVLNLYLTQLANFATLHGVLFQLFELIKDLERYEARYDEFAALYRRLALRSRSGQSLFPEIQNENEVSQQEVRDNIDNAAKRAMDSLDSVNHTIQTWRALGTTLVLHEATT